MTTRQPRYGDIFAGHDEGEMMAETARVLWAEYKADLESRGLFTAARGKIVDRLVRARTEYEVLYPLAVCEGPVKISADGGQYVNMLWSQVQKLNDQMLKLETSLTLTPSSVGASGGEAPQKQKATTADKYFDRATSTH